MLLLLLAVGLPSVRWLLREWRIPERMAIPIVPQPRTVSVSGGCGDDIVLGVGKDVAENGYLVGRIIVVLKVKSSVRTVINWNCMN